jgi:hypothetical protein
MRKTAPNNENGPINPNSFPRKASKYRLIKHPNSSENSMYPTIFPSSS